MKYEKLRERMWERGVSQSELAKELRVTQSAVSYKLKGDIAISAGEMRKIADLLEIKDKDLQDFFELQVQKRKLITEEERKRAQRYLLKGMIVARYHSLERCAEDLGWTTRRMYMITSGRAEPDTEDIADLANAVGWTVAKTLRVFL